MIFSELYSAYYNTVARIITAAFDKNTTEKDLDRIVSENAFSESVLTIMPSLKSGKWKLLDGSFKARADNAADIASETLAESRIA